MGWKIYVYIAVTILGMIGSGYTFYEMKYLKAQIDAKQSDITTLNTTIDYYKKSEEALNKKIVDFNNYIIKMKKELSNYDAYSQQVYNSRNQIVQSLNSINFKEINNENKKQYEDRINAINDSINELYN